MINRLIEFSLKNRFLIVLAYLLLAGWGYWALLSTPIDAISSGNCIDVAPMTPA